LGTTISDAWSKYRNTIAPNAKLSLFDLAGYGNTPLDLSKGNGVHLIAGWSEKYSMYCRRLMKEEMPLR
jgi:hypothetical protein